MTFQFACRKWLNQKDLEPAGPDSRFVNIEVAAKVEVADPLLFGGIRRLLAESILERNGSFEWE